MSTQVQLRRGTTADHATFTGAVGEATVDTTKDTLVVHDGATAGGFPLALESHTHAGTYQPVDATLTSIAALGTAADKLAYTTGVDTWAETAITSAARTVLDDATVAAMLATMGGAPLASPTFTGTPAAPTAAPLDNSTKLATTAYVEAAVAAGGGGGSPGGSSGLVQYNNAGAFGGAANLSIHSGDIVVATGTPTAPSAGSKLYSLDLAGRAMLAQIDATGVGLPMQASLARARVGHWNWPGGSTAPIAYGIVAPTVVGTAQIRTPTSTNLFTSMRRGGYLSAASAGSLASIRSGVAQFWRGNAAGLGGFYFVFRFGTSDPATVAGARMFVGLSTATGAASNVEPDTLTNAVGVCQLSTSGNLHFLTNDVSGTATTTDLGANFPANTLSVDMYELILYAPPNGSDIKWRVERLNTGDVLTGSASSDIPSPTTFLAIQAWRTNNATALAVALDAVSTYVETKH